MLHSLIANGNDDIDRRTGFDNLWETPLLYASRTRKHLETIKMLLNMSADIKATDIYGNTVLHNLAEVHRRFELHSF